MARLPPADSGIAQTLWTLSLSFQKESGWICSKLRVLARRQVRGRFARGAIFRFQEQKHVEEFPWPLGLEAEGWSGSSLSPSFVGPAATWVAINAPSQ